jgi:hypothetical protein
VTLVTLSLLTVLYLAVGIMGSKHAYNFLIVQARLKQVLLTAFYIFSIFTCLIRVITYLVIITVYFIKSNYAVGIAVRADMLGTYTVLALGTVQVLTCLQLGYNMQVILGEREKEPSTTKLLAALLTI